MGIGLQIAGGFGRRLSGYMQEKEKYDWENKRAERKFGMTTGTMGVAKAEEKAGVAVDKLKYLQERGLDNNILRFAWDQEKVAGIDKLYNEVQEGSAEATGEQLNKLVNLAKDYAATDDRPWSEVVREAMQIYATPENAKKATGKQKEQKSFWSAMLADPSSTSGYDDGKRYGGYTRADQDRIIMASATTPRGEGLLKLDRSKRIDEYDFRDYKGLALALDVPYKTAEYNLLESFKKMTDATAGAKEQQRYNKLKKAGKWFDITALYGDEILYPYLEQEQLKPNSVITNTSIDLKIRNWVELHTKDFPSIYNKSIPNIMKESDLTEEDIEALPKYPYIEAVIADRSKGKLKEGVDSFLLYNRATDEYQLIKGNTNTTSTVSSVSDEVIGKEEKDKEVGKPTDDQFITWAESLPIVRPKDYSGPMSKPFENKFSLQKKKGKWNIAKIKEQTKVITSKLGVEYDWDKWDKRGKLSWSPIKAKNLGLPYRWGNAEKEGYTVKYNLSRGK